MFLTKNIISVGGRNTNTKVNASFKRINFPSQKKINNLYGSKSGPVFRFDIAVRTYARVSTRRTKVAEDEELGERKQTDLGKFSETEKDLRSQQFFQPASEEGLTTEQTLTPAIKTHLFKVYGTLFGGTTLAAAGAIGGVLFPVLAIPAFIGSFIGIIGLAFMRQSTVTARQNMFLAITTLVGISLGPLLAVSAPGVIFAAALGTSAIFGGFSLMAMKAKSNAMLMLGGPLLGGLLLIFSCGLASFLLPMIGVTSPAILGALYNINLYGGLALFSLFISYDTQRMIADYKMGDTDHIRPALSLFLNIINIFVRLLEIFRR